MTINGAQKSAEAFRTISEVAEALKLPQHVLRFWETRFTQIKPLKRAGGRRFYRPEDVELLGAIRQLLYGEGYTIKGVQRILREQGPRAVATLARQHARPTSDDALEAAQAEPADDEMSGPVDDEGVLPWAEEPASGDREPSTADSEARWHEPATDDPVARLEAVLTELEACRRILAGAR